MRSFRVSLWPLILFALAVVGVAGVAVAVVLHLRGATVTRPGLSALILAAGGALVLLAAAVMKVQVLPDGLRCADAFGWYQFVRWDEIVAASSVGFPGLRYLRVEAAGGVRVVWLPLFLADREGFLNLVRELAGDHHPVVRAMERGKRGTP